MHCRIHHSRNNVMLFQNTFIVYLSRDSAIVTTAIFNCFQQYPKVNKRLLFQNCCILKVRCELKVKQSETL